MAESVTTLSELARQHCSNRNFDGAIELYGQILAIDPAHDEARTQTITICCQLSQDFQRQGKMVEALLYLRRATELESRLVGPDVHLIIADFSLSRGEFEAAINSCQRILTIDRTHEQASIKLAEISLAQGRLDQGLSVYDDLIQAVPALAQMGTTEHVARSFLYKRGKLWSEINNLKDLLQEREGDVVPSDEVQFSRFLLAREQARKGNLGQAVPIYEKLLAESSGESILPLHLGHLYMSWASVSGNGDMWNRARQAYAMAVSRNPRSAEACYYLGLIISMTSREFTQVEALQKRATELDPGYIEPYLELAEAISRQRGKASECKNYFQRWIELKNARSAAHPVGKAGIRFLNDGITYAMGHLAELPDVYIKMQKLGWMPEYRSILLAPPWKIANRALLEYWRDHFEIITDPETIQRHSGLAKELNLDLAYLKMPDGKVMHATLAKSLVQREWEKQWRAPLLKLSQEHLERGWAQLEKQGVPRNSWFVSVHVREPGFKGEGDSIFNRHRNADIMSYQKAFKLITDRGGWIVRMGEPSMRPLPASPNTFDYAHSPDKSDWFDLFLCSQCRFYIGTSGGLFATPQIFGVPLVTTNFPPFSPLQYNGQDIYLSKLLVQEGDGKRLSFREILSPPLYQCEEGQNFADRKLRFIDNTPDELAEATLEMLQKLDGAMVYTDEDNLLQEQFRKLIPEGCGAFISRVGRDFLKRNRDLL